MSDLGNAEGTARNGMEKIEFSMKQFAKRRGQPNYSALTEWKKVSEAGLLVKKHQGILQGKYWNEEASRWTAGLCDGS